MAELPPPPVINVDDIDTALAPPLPTPPAIAPSSSFSSSLSQPAPTAAPIHSTPASLGVMTEDELLKQALALSREEHGREQQRRAMATMPPVQMPPAPAPRMQAGVVDMRTLEAQMAAAGIGYEVEYGSDDDLPTVSAAGVASASASASAARPPPLAAPSLPPVPSFVSTSSSSLFSAAPAAPDAAAKAALGRIQPPPSHAFAPPPPAPVLPGLEPGYGDEDEGDGCDGEDDDEPPTDLTCPIKFMLLLDPGACFEGLGWIVLVMGLEG